MYLYEVCLLFNKINCFKILMIDAVYDYFNGDSAVGSLYQSTLAQVQQFTLELLNKYYLKAKVKGIMNNEARLKVHSLLVILTGS